MKNKNPFSEFKSWWKYAATRVKLPEAMTLATATKSGKPSARTVFLKGFDSEGFVFFTNYGSRKGKELLENPYAALLFFWKDIGRQVRITGKVTRVSKRESEEYFHSRGRESQLGAWASSQSKPIQSRKELMRRFAFFKNKFEGKTVPLPPHWGGFRLTPDTFEFWNEGTHRLHERVFYKKGRGRWNITTLAP